MSDPSVEDYVRAMATEFGLDPDKAVAAAKEMTRPTWLGLFGVDPDFDKDAPDEDAIRAVLREADDMWMPSQPRELFERLWDLIGGRDEPLA